jgi:hypothetical protein
LPKNIAVGDTVAFEIRPGKDGMFDIVTISPAAPVQDRKDNATGAPMKGDMKAGKAGAAQ